MPHHNCHSIERKLDHAKDKLDEIRTNINIHNQYLKTHPGHAPTIKELNDLRKLEHQQEETVKNIKGELDVCEAQNDMDKDKHDKDKDKDKDQGH